MEKHNRVTMLGCPISSLSMAQTVALIDKGIRAGSTVRHVAVDAGKLAALHDDAFLAALVKANDIISADGQSLVWLSRLYGHSLPERVTDIDLMSSLIELACSEGYRISLLGNDEYTLTRAAQKIARRYTASIIAGCHCLPANGGNDGAVARQIADTRPQMLFAGLGSPREEIFFYRQQAVLKDIPFLTGVNEGFRIIAGDVIRSPVWLRRLGLEWFFRFLQNPFTTWRSEVVQSFYFLWLLAIEKRSIC